jgi:hypothetical protein
VNSSVNRSGTYCIPFITHDFYIASQTVIPTITETPRLAEYTRRTQSGSRLENVTDYDNINGDEFFICAYQILDIDMNRYETIGTATEERISTYRYMLAYKSPAISLTKVPLGVRVETFHDGTVSNAGQVISYISTIATKLCFLYTYVVYEYQSDGTALIQRRVVGLVNLSIPDVPVGYNKEWEIDEINKDIMLKPFPTIDYKNLMAIGIHKGG